MSCHVQWDLSCHDLVRHPQQKAAHQGDTHIRAYKITGVFLRAHVRGNEWFVVNDRELQPL